MATPQTKREEENQYCHRKEIRFQRNTIAFLVSLRVQSWKVRRRKSQHRGRAQYYLPVGLVVEEKLYSKFGDDYKRNNYSSL